MEIGILAAYNALAFSNVPEGARLFGGGVDAAAELMDGSRVPSSPTYVYLSDDPGASPIDEVYVFDGETSEWYLAADSQVYSDGRGILQVFAVPNDPYRVWVDFGAGKVGMSPGDTHLVLQQHMASVEAHPDMRLEIAALRASLESLEVRSGDLDEIWDQLSVLEQRASEAHSRATSARDTSTANSVRLTNAEQRITALETADPCLRVPVLWDMPGEIGSSISKHRYTNLHSHEQEITLFYVEADILQGGDVTVYLMERDRETGQTFDITSATLTPENKYYETEDFLYVLQEGKQIVPEVVVGSGAEGLDLTVQVYVQ